MTIDCPSCDSEMENINGNYRCLECDERVSSTQIGLVSFAFAKTRESSIWWSLGKFLAWNTGLISGVIAADQLSNIGFFVGITGLVSAGLFLLAIEIVEQHVHRV